MENTVLARIVHGSHLFGLATERSDRDYVSIVLPSSRLILTGEADFISSEGSTSDSTRRNTHEDVDDKQISLSAFVRMAMSGTLDMIELLNAPMDFHTMEPHPLFLELRNSRDRLASRNVDKIVGFCRQQAVTYSPRKERLVAAQKAVETLIHLGVGDTTKERAGDYFERVVSACASEYVSVSMIPNPNGRDIAHMDICGKMVPETVNASQALAVAGSAIKRYGMRVNHAASTSTHDWKSLSHALRIATEGIEYVRTGRITLPVPGRERLLDIKLGRIPLGEVAEEVDAAVRALESDARNSLLPEKPDEAFASEFVISAHGNRVVSEFEELEASFEGGGGLMLSTGRAMLS